MMNSIVSYLFKSEYRKASLALTVSEAIRALLLLMQDVNSPVYPQLVFVISVFVIWLNYTLDIFVAKDSFVETSSSSSSLDIEMFNVKDPKIKWYLNSFIRYNFVKYLVVILISYITSSVIVTYLKEMLNEKNIGRNFKHRDIIIQSVVNLFSFGLYTYFLKFRWAYATDSNYVMTMVVLSWCSMSLIMYMIFLSVYVPIDNTVDIKNNPYPNNTNA